MNRKDVAYLVVKTWTQDAYGVNHETATERKIFVQVQSVTGSEWFEGGRNGLNPELRFTTNQWDYDGEEELKYNGNYYRIYRTYLNNDRIELYCERRKGYAD